MVGAWHLLLLFPLYLHLLHYQQSHHGKHFFALLLLDQHIQILLFCHARVQDISLPRPYRDPR